MGIEMIKYLLKPLKWLSRILGLEIGVCTKCGREGEPWQDGDFICPACYFGDDINRDYENNIKPFEKRF